MQPSLPQRTHTFSAGLFGDFEFGSLRQNDALDVFGHGHHLVDAHPAFVAVVAGRTSDRVVGLPAAVYFIFFKARLQQGFMRNMRRGLTHRAQLACQALRGDQDHAGRNIEGRDAHVAHPCQGGRCVVGM